MSAFRIIPVIDLRGGLVVRARAGDRDAYAPIVTPLASTAHPVEVACGMLAACPSDTLYLADLDAIVEGRPPDLASYEAIRVACPGVNLWVDAGFSTLLALEFFLASGLGRPVLGSESQTDSGFARVLGDRAVLSLDTQGDQPLGPAALHDDPSLWPRDVIVMTLARVGVGGGPDLSRIAEAVRRRPDASVYGAGGVRGAEDIAALEQGGAAGALVASAIHDGRFPAVS